MIEERCIAIETKLAYLEDFVNKLQNITVEQGHMIDLLSSENRMLKDKFRELQDSLEDMPNVRPPHY